MCSTSSAWLPPFSVYVDDVWRYIGFNSPQSIMIVMIMIAVIDFTLEKLSMLPYSGRKVFDSGSKFFMKFVMLALCALLVMASTSGVVGVHAQETHSVTLTPVADANVSPWFPDKNFGGDGALWIDYRPGEQKGALTYLMFNLSVIPRFAVINSATLSLYLTEGGGWPPRPVRIGAHYCSNTAWKESEVAWSSSPYFLQVPTSISVAEWIITPSITELKEGRYSWDITRDLKNAVQMGMLTEVLKVEDTDLSVYASFYSKEADFQPKLIVDYAAATAKISASGLPPTLSTNVYLDGSKAGTLSKGESKTFEFEEGTYHTIKIDGYVSGSTGVRYYCPSNSWTFSSTGSKEFSYTTQYYLTVKTEYGSSKGEGWYDAGSKATISAASSGGGYVFSGWTGDLTSPDAASTVIMDKPKTVTATWKVSYIISNAILTNFIAIVGALLLVLVMREEY